MTQVAASPAPVASSDFTVAVQLDADDARAFAAISDPRSWWSRDIAGDTDHLGAEFEFEVDGIHYSRQRISAFVPDELVVWDVTEARLTFIADETEWVGTSIRFDIRPLAGGRSEVRFTHVGLRPDVECYDACSTAWRSYITGSLRRLAEEGVGTPSQEEPSGEFAEIAEQLRRR